MVCVDDEQLVQGLKLDLITYKPQWDEVGADGDP